MDIIKLKSWFSMEKRDLPWRSVNDPYAIWVSEIMLQQTQVSVVESYFLRWMHKFPTINDLAKANVEDVIKVWEGLGYYSRARNLHEGARYIVDHFESEFPDNEKDIKKIKGIGPYTLGAIMSFAFHQKKAAVDGNVIRVLARQFNITEDVSKTATQKKIWEFATSLLPDDESWVVSEALIELGATVCRRVPNCKPCPVKESCLAYKTGTALKLPFKEKKVKIVNLYRAVAVIRFDQHYLVRKGKKGAIFSDLFEFPFFEISKEGIDSKTLMEKLIKMGFHSVCEEAMLPSLKHGFTKYDARLDPSLFHTDHKVSVEGFEWVSFKEMDLLPFSSGHRRILEQIRLLKHSGELD